MTEKYSIYTTADPGPQLVELAAELIKPLSTVEAVRFVAFNKVTENRPGVFIPSEKEIYIDLGNILNNADLYRLGMNYIPAVYYTALWTLFHEVTHARQCEEDPELAELIIDAEDYERAAQEATKDLIRQWTEKNELPPLAEWGYLGERISQAINNLYAKGDAKLLSEMEAMEHGAVAEVSAILAIYDFEYPRMLSEAIANGEFGVKIDGSHFLTAPDFFGLDNPIKESAGAAQTVSME